MHKAHKNAVYIENYGCASNMNDGEIMAGMLSRAGYDVSKNPENSYIIIINTCCVKEATVNKNMSRIRELASSYPEKRIIVAGCIPEVYHERIQETGADIIGTNHITKIPMLVEKIINGKRVEKTGISREIKLCLPKIRENETVNIVPVCSGCVSACTYCATRIAKGRLLSYPESKIIAEIKGAKLFGAKEFWITGQDVSAYGLDISEKPLLPELVEKITCQIKGKYLMRIGMLNPRHVLKDIEGFCGIYGSERVFKFLHLPVQSGSDAVLEKMARGYCSGDFLRIVRMFRKHVPGITIWTDIITGFPGETDDDFIDSVKLVEKTMPDFVNISKFSSHPGTAASSMKQVPTDIRKKRSMYMTNIVEEICSEKNKKWVGSKCEVLVDEYNDRKKNFIARNMFYKPVAMSGNIRKGMFMDAEITGSCASCLFGRAVG